MEIYFKKRLSNQLPQESTEIYAKYVSDIKHQKTQISTTQEATKTQTRRRWRLSTYRRICHAPPHLIGAAIRCGTITSREASRSRHFHFIGWIHRHRTHAAARREILLELQRLGRAFKWRWRINFADFILHWHGGKERTGGAVRWV